MMGGGCGEVRKSGERKKMCAQVSEEGKWR